MQLLAGEGEHPAVGVVDDHELPRAQELEVEPAGVAFEATYGWGWFADLLSDVGIPAHMAHPLATKAISSARVKNDCVDAKTLAHLLRTNLLPEAWAAPPEVRDARKLTRTRISLARISSRLKCQTHALLADQAITPPMTDVFGLAGRAFLEGVRLRPILWGSETPITRLTCKFAGGDGTPQDALPRLRNRSPHLGFETS